jgi:hypothetical protein
MRMLREEINSVAFMAHPYSWSVIGNESDIKAWTQQDLETYFKTYYAPNNAVSVIVGDVKTAEVKKLAAKYFGAIPKRPLPPAVRTIEPPQKGERRVFVAKESATSANLTVAYKIPAANNPDYYALEVLQSLLADGKTSRLYKALVEQQLATAVSANSLDGFDPGLLYVSAVAASKVEPAVLEKALLATLDEVVRNGVTQRGTAEGQEPEAGQPVPRAGNHQRQGAATGQLRSLLRRLQEDVRRPGAIRKTDAGRYPGRGRQIPEKIAAHRRRAGREGGLNHENKHHHRSSPRIIAAVLAACAAIGIRSGIPPARV